MDYIIFFLKLVVDKPIDYAGFSRAAVSKEDYLIGLFAKGRWGYWHEFYIFKISLL